LRRGKEGGGIKIIREHIMFNDEKILHDGGNK
jgi:hypothetical protein